jgi:hypothetical protein
MFRGKIKGEEGGRRTAELTEKTRGEGQKGK